MTTLFVILALVGTLALAAGAFWLRRRAALARLGTWEDVQTRARQGGYRLISTAELGEMYQRPDKDLTLVDTREDSIYRAGRIPGAVNLPLTPSWRALRRCREPLESLLGPEKEQILVFY